MPNAHFANISQSARSRAARILLAVCLLIPCAARVGAETPPAAGPDPVSGQQQVAPAHLVIENVGQYASEARFLLVQGQQRVWLAGDAIWLTVPDPTTADEQAGPDAAGSLSASAPHRPPGVSARSGTAIRFTFPDANPAPTLEPYAPLPTQVSYLIGSDPERWHRDVPVWSGVRYRDFYPGIDLIVGDGIEGDRVGNSVAGIVPWRFEARAGADLKAVTLRAEGADAVRAEVGRIRLEMKGRAVDVMLPSWTLAGQPERVESAVTAEAENDTFALSPASGQQPEPASAAATAGIDNPADLVYSTFLGGMAGEEGYAIAVDTLGNAYVTGETASTDFPQAPGGYSGAIDAFVAKLDGGGTSLLYATYLGGNDLDKGWGIAVDGDLAYIVGETTSTDFPDDQPLGDSDIFAAALSPDGNNVRYASRVGGAGYETSRGIAVAGTDVYVVGSTVSSIAQGPSCVDTTVGDLLVARLDAALKPLSIACLGGSDYETGNAIAVRNGEVYVTGESYSSNFPNPPAGGWPGGGDILVARFTPGLGLAGSKLIGGRSQDGGNGIAVDLTGNIYIAGLTTSSGFPSASNSLKGFSDAIVLKLTSAFATSFATYLGGTGGENGDKIAVDTVQGIYVVGTTTSTNFPVTAGAYDESFNLENDVFVARLHLSSSSRPDKVTYATYVGSTNHDEGHGIVTDTGEHAFITGGTGSAAFPTQNPNDASLGGTRDAFVAKLKMSDPPTPPSNLSIAAFLPLVTLSWGPVAGAAKYQVLRSEMPYFQPGDWSSSVLAEPAAPATSCDDEDALLPPAPNAYFYVVKAVDGTPAASANSDRVGKFTFGLVKGN